MHFPPDPQFTNKQGSDGGGGGGVAQRLVTSSQMYVLVAASQTRPEGGVEDPVKHLSPATELA